MRMRISSWQACVFRCRVFTVLFLSCFLILAAGCQKNGFIGRGGDGAVRSPNPDQITEMNGQNLAPAQAQCGTLFTVSGRAAKGVLNCQNVGGYQDIYQRAQQMAQAQLSAVNCPATCAPLQSVESARIWNCVRSDPNTPAIAISTVERTALCPQQGGTPLPADLGTPPAASLNAPQGTLADLSQQPGIIHDASPGSEVACPGRRVVRVDYQDMAPQTCRKARFDYQPYVERATALAEEEWKRFTCAQGCTKAAPFTTVRRQWRCNRKEPSGSLVEARLWYEVNCQQPGTSDGSEEGHENGNGENH